MKEPPLRFVLAIYSAGEGDPEGAYAALRVGRQDKTFLFRPENGAQHSPLWGSFAFRNRSIADYAALRLNGESMVAVEAKPSDVEDVVQRLAEYRISGHFRSTRRNHLRYRCRSAQGLATRETKDHKRSIFSQLQENEAALDLARRDLAEATRMGHSLTAAAEWILDNAYLVRTQIAEIHRNLPPNYAKHVSELTPGYDLAKELVVRSENSLNENNITDCLHRCQTGQPSPSQSCGFSRCCCGWR